jgi:hypothetical protein
MITSFNSEAFVTQIVPITKNKIVNYENINRMLTYFQNEIVIDRSSWGSKYNEYKPVVGHFKPLYNDVQQLLGVQLPAEILDKISYKGLDGQSINPTNEIVDILGNISEFSDRVPENCAIIVITYRNIIIGYISVVVDSRSTFDGKNNFFYTPAGKVAYFMGIRKSAALMAAQQYPKLANFDQNYKSMLTEFRLSETIVPAVEDYSRSLNSEYLVTTPLSNMQKILSKHYGFQGPQINTMLNLYRPPVYMMMIAGERIVWKKISYDESEEY